MYSMLRHWKRSLLELQHLYNKIGTKLVSILRHRIMSEFSGAPAVPTETDILYYFTLASVLFIYFVRWTSYRVFFTAPLPERVETDVFR